MKKGSNSRLLADEIEIGENVVIGEGVTIRASKISIGDDTTIESGTSIHCPDGFELGRCSYVGPQNDILCREMRVGAYLYMKDHVEVGHGGRAGVNSRLFIGDGVMVCERTTLNTSERVEIGHDVGIGADVKVWTHGSYLGILDGFPAAFAPVKIGSHVWIPASTQIMPGVTVGDHVVLGVSTIVNRDIPSGCMAAGIPVKVIRENIYPRPLDESAREKLVRAILDDWRVLIADKGVESVAIRYEAGKIVVVEAEGETVLRLDTKEMSGSTPVSEDLRDFLRRRGIKFFTGRPFRSLPVPAFQREYRQEL